MSDLMDAGVLASLLQLQADPTLLAALIQGLLLEGPAAPATTGGGAADRDDPAVLARGTPEAGPDGRKRKRAGAPEAAASVAGHRDGALPSEAQPLASLLAFAKELTGSNASASSGLQREQEPLTLPVLKKRRAAALSSPPAIDATANTSMLIKGSQEATVTLREALAAQRSPSSADVDWLSMQTMLLRADRAAVQKLLTELAVLAASSTAGGQAAGVLLWVCQAHAIQPPLYGMAPSGGVRAWVGAQPLWDTAPFLLLLRAVTAEQGNGPLL